MRIHEEGVATVPAAVRLPVAYSPPPSFTQGSVTVDFEPTSRRPIITLTDITSTTPANSFDISYYAQNPGTFDGQYKKFYIYSSDLEIKTIRWRVWRWSD